LDELERAALGAPPWRHSLIGMGQLEQCAGRLRLTVAAPCADRYSDAQIDDYQRRSIRPLGHRAPLRLRLRARFSAEASELRGTAGFGFWNYPSAWPPAPPRALWFFFGSPPHELPLAMGVPGHGWKAATIDTGRPRALTLLPIAPLLIPLLRQPALYRGLWPPIQRALGVAEVCLHTTMADWHEYEIVWGKRTSRLLVDGRTVLADAPSPHGPMCLVIWIDNQYLVATPQGRLAWGLVATPQAQWLELDALELTR
jgi:hypothetical protein